MRPNATAVGVVTCLVLAAAAHAGTRPRVTLGEAHVEAGSTVTPVEIDDATALLAGDVDLLFDADRVDLVEVRRGGLPSSFFLLHNIVGDTLRISFASAQAAAGGRLVLFEIVTTGSGVPRFAFLLVTLNGEQVALATAVADAVATVAVGADGLRAFRVLVDGGWASGLCVVAWDGKDAQGRQVASGRYLALLQAEGRRLSVPLVLVR